MNFDKWDRYLAIITLAVVSLVLAIGYSIGRWFNG